MKTAREIRQAFLGYFRERSHEVVSSSPLVPQNDPTLMFTNAGMVQFKDVFTGKDKRPYRRAASSQKCIRISGKHNDLENVGVTARHHTFFEMLGNFSFGDYFKQEAIAYAWDFITRVMGIPGERLVVSVFGGEAGIEADEEAARIWAEVAGVPPERIMRCGLADNFWAMGDTGPCGPCSEIYYFVGDGPGEPASFGEEPAVDGTGWTEIWNLVFMQFVRHEKDGALEPLPAPSVDTGMGLERLSVVVQGVKSNYDTDLLRPIVDLAAELSGKSYGGTLAPDDISMRVIADHARTTAFLIAEGVFPDKERREYVLRRVMRRAIWHGERLGIERPFLHECALRVVDSMGADYPELAERRALIDQIVVQEERRFRSTLRRGLEILEKNDEWTGEEGARLLPGAVAFKLHDTYGFPVDLQEIIGQAQGFRVDQDGFEAEMERARERSQGSKVGERAVEEVHRSIHSEVGDSAFVGHEQEWAISEVLALLRNGERVAQLAAGEEGDVVVKKTPFYAESGGQAGDQGTITVGDSIFEVRDTHKPVGALHVHTGVMLAGTLATGAEVRLEVDHERRAATRRNHSATHLLHYALRKVVGPQAMQKGSLVGPERLRFDYSSSRPLTAEEIARIEDLVNEKILLNAPITTEVLPMKEAKRRGAIGIFEEKYGEVVRMLTMTPDSIELCGGTHAARTGDIGVFKILSEGGLAAGVRRVEAATGWNVLRLVREMETELGETAALVKAPASRPREKVRRLVDQQRELQREVEDLKRRLVEGGGQDLTAGAREVGGVRVLGVLVDLGDPKALRELADKLRDRLAPAVVLVGTEAQGGKVLLACSVSREVTDRYQAGAIIRDAAAIVGGGGGGRPDFAQAGGTDASRLDEAVRRVYDLVSAGG